MKRVVASWKDGFANIAADHMVEREGMIYAYNEQGEVVGVFDLGIINYIYITEGKNESKT